MHRLFWKLSFVLLSGGSLLAATVSGLSTKVSNNIHHHHSSRRNWIGKVVISSSAAFTLCNIANPPSPATAAAQEVEELPSELRKFTALAPLGEATSTGNKLIGLSLEDIASRLSHDLVEGCTGKGGYFISGMYIDTTIYHYQGRELLAACFSKLISRLFCFHFALHR
jgi:hypothetical protein